MSYAVETYSMCNETNQIISDRKVFEFDLPKNDEDAYVERKLCLLDAFRYFQNKFSEIEKKPSIVLCVSSVMVINNYSENQYEIASYHKTPNSEKWLKIHYEDDADFIFQNDMFRKRTDKMWESSFGEEESTKEDIDLAQLSEISYGKNGDDND
jgi:hypothetical protein